VPVSVDCPSCKGRLLFPDQLWEQRFAQRVQRLKCKKCTNVVSIDGRSAGSGGDADLEEEDAEATIRMLLPGFMPESLAPAPSEVPPLSDPPTPALVQVPSHPPARRTVPPRQATSGRVSRFPARGTQSQPALSVVSARLDAAVALEAAPPCESSSNQEAPAPSCIESRVALVAEPSEQPSPGADARPELPPADSKPESAIVQVAAPQPIPSQARASVRTAPLARASSVQAKRSGQGRWRWLVLSGLAAIALLSVRACMPGSAEPQQLAVRDATLDLVAPPLAGESVERRGPTSAPVATAPLPEDATEVAAEPAPADSPNTADNSEQSKQLGADARGLPARRAAKKTAPSADAARPASAMPYDKATLAQALSAVLQKAEQCDLWGRATGTAKLFVTFAPTGRVTDASLVGEPLQSAAVARCILHHARAASLPPFAGPAFTISRKITLR